MLSSLASTGSVSNTGSIIGNVGNSAAFANNGVVTGAFFNAGVLSGNGTIVGPVANVGVLAPGNSIGTMTINGSLAQSASGTYQVETNAAGQSDLVSVTGTPGAAALNGTVSVVGRLRRPGAAHDLHHPQRHRRHRRHLRLGEQPLSVPAAVARLRRQQRLPDAADRRLRCRGADGDAPGVGRVLDANVFTASGDFATVLGTMATNTQSPALAQATLTALSGQNYSSFSTSMVLGAQLFMNNFADQTGGAGTPFAGRVALAEACDVACDGPPPAAAWGAWGGALGGLA